MRNRTVFIFLLSIFFAAQARADQQYLPDILSPSELAEEMNLPETDSPLDYFNREMLATPEQRQMQFKPLEEEIKLAKLVIIIDRSEKGTRPSSQTMRIFYNERELEYPLGLDGNLRTEIKISTGAPGFGTPVGYFRPDPKRIFQRYVSQKYNAPMPYAIFFNGGVALHATAVSNYPFLGSRASHGCVRQTLEDSRWVFGLVKSTLAAAPGIPWISRNGDYTKTADGNFDIRPGYDTVIVVKE